MVLLLGGANGAFVADGQLVTAPCTAAGNHGPTVLRLHAFTETVSFGPFAIIGLESAFRHVAALSRMECCKSRAGAEAQTSPRARPKL